MNVTTGGSITGGTTVALTPAGLAAGNKATFVAPGHTRLEPRLVDFIVTPPKTSSTEPGTARSGLKIAFASRVQEEGCCTVSPGTVIFDVGIRWPLGQPETLVDEAIALLKGLVWTTAFADSIKKGTLPSS